MRPTIALPPLSETQARELVRLAGGRERAEPRRDRRDRRQRGGQPAVLRRVHPDAGRPRTARRRRARTSPRSRSGTLPVPESVRGIIASRLDSLPAEEKALIQAGAVMGRVVWPGALSAITGHPRRWVVRRLRLLEEPSVPGPARQSSVEHEPEYRFRHVLIRDVAYSAVPRQRRGEMHQRTAEWLESLSPDRAADRAEMLAHHYLSAPTSWPARPATRRAPARRPRAPRAARRRRPRPEPPRLPGRGPASSGPRSICGRTRIPTALGCSSALASRSTTPRPPAPRCSEEARDALLAAGDRGTAARGRGVPGPPRSPPGRARSGGRAPRSGRGAWWRPSGPPRSKAEVLVDLANYLSIATEHERTITAATEALEIARQLESARARGQRAVDDRDLARALRRRRRAAGPRAQHRAHRADRARTSALHCCGMLADLERQIGDLPACFGLQARARVHAERFGHAGFVRWLAPSASARRTGRGDWDGALTAADGLIAEAEAGVPNFMVG